MTTDVSTLRLHIRYDEGEGPIMVLLHGINSDGTDWRKVMDTIGGGYRFIAPDLLGFGESPKPDDIDYTAEQHAQVLDATLCDLGVDRPFMLVGYSLGGDIAIRYASTFPGKVRRLFLLSTPFYLPPAAFDKQGFGLQYLKVIVFQQAWKFISRSKGNDNPLYQFADGRGEDFAKQFLRTDDVPKHWDIMSKNLRNCIGKATFVDDLPKLDMPVTFALGIRDPIVHPDQTPDLKRLKPDIDIRRIVGLSADHFMLLNLPETVAAEIMRDEVESLNVRYRSGSGQTTVFLHDIFEDPRFWQPVATALSTRREVALIDLLGFGDSPTPLSSLYDVGDHTDAVISTLLARFPGRKVRLVGHGFGAVVALYVAGSAADLVDDVVAFSPLLLSPGTDQHSESSTAAEVLSMHERIEHMLGDRRSQVAADKSEERVIPLLRSVENGVMRVDAAALVNSDHLPTLLVIPTDDADTPGSYLTSSAVTSEHHITLVEPAGTRLMPLDDPAATVLLLDPGATAAAANAATLPRPKPNEALDGLRAAFTSTSNAVMFRGLGLLVLGAWSASLNSLNTRLVSIGFAIWVAVEGITTIAGAVGLRRKGSSAWLPWLLVGILSFAVAWLLLTRVEFNIAVLSLVVMFRALYIGAANLYVASRVSNTPVARWALVGEGLLGIALAVAIMFGAGHGALLLQYILSIYFVASGVSAIAYALANQLTVRKRVRSAVARNSAGRV